MAVSISKRSLIKYLESLPDDSSFQTLDGFLYISSDKLNDAIATLHDVSPAAPKHAKRVRELSAMLEAICEECQEKCTHFVPCAKCNERPENCECTGGWHDPDEKQEQVF